MRLFPIECAQPSTALRALPSDSASQLNILGHDCDTLGVDGAQVGVFEQTNQVGLGGFLQGQDGRPLESEIRLEILGNLTDETLKGQLADQKVRRFLVSTDLTKSDGTRSVSVGLLDTSSGWGGLASGLGGELLSGSLSSGGLAGGLLSKEEIDEHTNRQRLPCLEPSIRARDKGTTVVVVVLTFVLAIFTIASWTWCRKELCAWGACVSCTLRGGVPFAGCTVRKKDGTVWPAAVAPDLAT
jgi:hypothetical protein